MTPDQRRNFNTTFGGVFLAMGILAWLLAVYFAVVPRMPAPPLMAAASVDLDSCRMALNNLGYVATTRANEVSAFESLSGQPRDQLEKASIAVSLCQLTLHTFCMGDGCERPGLTLVLRRPAEFAPIAGTPVAGASAPAVAVKKPAVPVKKD